VPSIPPEAPYIIKTYLDDALVRGWLRGG
jgi:hypothetical protein